MEQNINSLISNINNSLAWIRKYKPADYDQKFLQLIEERRKLIKIRNAGRDNPAIAAYGVSQVGKSYLMNCMLQKDGQPFLLKADGKTYKFIEEMNPKTDNTEATGVVTRFTSFKRNPERYSEKYPILMRCLSVADIILILSDGYYIDIENSLLYLESEIKEEIVKLYEKYRNLPRASVVTVTPDDVLNIKAYYKQHLFKATQTYLQTSLFDTLTLIADRIPVSELSDVFSLLWHKSEYQTRLFKRILSTLEKFHFAEFVYLPAQSMLHDGRNENTIMSVQCLNELFLDSPKYFTDAYIRNGDAYEKVANLSKSEVCAVCAEIIIKIDDEYINTINHYSLAGITDDAVKKELSRKGEIIINSQTGDKEIHLTMSVLKDNDMLDFPGARSREQLSLDTLEKDANLIMVLLRGKVAYLFNKYNESMLINVLLYCHHAAQNEVRDIPRLLSDWIKNYVGDTMEKRRNTLAMTDGISPLFYVATKFNMDMALKAEDIANERNSVNGRWDGRFHQVLYKECFKVEAEIDEEKKEIYNNWTRPGEHFQNSYLLRDFKFSGPITSKLYDNERTADRKMLIPQDYYDLMRSTFIENEWVKFFFENPALAWDVAASIDNDGALYIIERLSKVAEKMGKTRDAQLHQMFATVEKKVYATMKDYYVSTDVDELLNNNIRKAKAIFREMDFTCNSDNYFFGHLLQGLQLTEAEAYRVVHAVMQGPDINEQVNDFKDYEIIKNSCKNNGTPIEEAATEEEKWKCIMQTYGFDDCQDAEDFLQKKGINVASLFSDSYKRKLNSCIIADAVYEHWKATIKSVDFFNEYADDDHIDSSAMTSLTDNIISTSEAIHLNDLMAESIAHYVNVIKIHTANESLLADMLASLINDFVLDFGYRYLSVEDIEKVKGVCEKCNLIAFDYILKDDFKVSDEKELTDLFNKMSTNPSALLPSFDDNYNKWKEFMMISFIAHLDIPNIDFEANEAMKTILEGIKGTTK